ncbi:MAG TPA: hypothetical protein VMM38_06385 [Aridibacter sp.]|nr:hypothetical protein [Aridibacter sp.]
MFVAFIHLLLAGFLIYLSRWVGEKSASYGYVPLSIFDIELYNPAFNLFFRIATPLVFVLLTSSLFYGVGLDWLVKDIYNLVILYFVLRVILLFILGKAYLVNWLFEVLVGLTSITIAYALYWKVIVTKQNLVPNYSDLSNELWIIVIVFVYTALNKIEFSNKGSERRKQRYLDRTYNRLSERFSKIVIREVRTVGSQSELEQKKLIATIYSIMIFESFNRPAAVRFFEYLLTPFRKKSTLGIMQIETTKIIDDEESILLASRRLLEAYSSAKQELEREISINRDAQEIQDEALGHAIYDYNPSYEYLYQIEEIKDAILPKITEVQARE